ncbi:unnamed protein product, partial [Mesocestoides corti]|uniref:ANK_REP_REGION domain-containing protein n=1 Tax=Mesocestoides corti TaxID=53468 RepID=A0A0R3UDD0_MESCO
MVESSLPPAKEMRDGEVQVGLKLVPQTVKVQQVKVENMEAVVTSKKSSESKQLDVNALLCSSAVQYDQVLAESTGVDVLPIAEARELSLVHGRNRFVTTVSSKYNAMQSGSYEGVSKSFDDKTIPLESNLSRTSTSGGFTDLHDSEQQTSLRVRFAEYTVPQSSGGSGSNVSMKPQHVNMSTQVGAVLVPLELSMQKMALDSSRVEVSTGLSRSGLHSVLCPTDMQATVALSDAPGIKLANVQGELAVQYNNAKYSADVVCDSVGTSACVRLLDKSISLDRKRSGLNLALFKPRFEGSSSGSMATRESYYNSANKRVISVSSQVGTLLVPTKIHMDKVDVEHLAVDVPVMEGDTVDLKVSAILASSATEMVPVITDTTGIQVVEMKDVEEVGIQLGENVYVTNVVPPSNKRTAGASGVSRDFRIGSTDCTRKQDSIVIPIERSHQTSQMTQHSRTILQQSAELRAVTSSLQSSEVQPMLRKGSVAAGWSPKCLNTNNFSQGLTESTHSMLFAGPPQTSFSSEEISTKAEYTTEPSLRSGMWSDRNRASMVDGVAQVGLNLVP